MPIWPRTLRDQNPGLLGPTLEVERGVEVRYFVCSLVGLLLAAEARGEERGRAHHFSPSMPPPRTRGDGALATVLRMLRAAAAGHVVGRGGAQR